MPPRIKVNDQRLAESFGFAVEAPPERNVTRRSKYEDLWEAARTFCTNNPGVTIKVRDFNSASHAYNVAKEINNGEHKFFKSDADQWVAVAGTKDDGTIGLWLTYNPPFDEE